MTEGSGKCQEFCSSSSIWDYRVGTIYKWVHSLFKHDQVKDLRQTLCLAPHTAKTKCRKFEKNIPGKENRGLSPNFHIHAPVSELYIPTMGLPFLLEEICGPILGIYKWLTDTWLWKWGWGRAIPRKGIYKRNCHVAVHPVCKCSSRIRRSSTEVKTSLKVHKIENFFDSDFGICVISVSYVKILRFYKNIFELGHYWGRYDFSAQS